MNFNPANASGHITLNTPVLVRSPKLSNVESSQYLDGWPPGNTGCCWLPSFFFYFFPRLLLTFGQDFFKISSRISRVFAKSGWKILEECWKTQQTRDKLHRMKTRAKKVEIFNLSLIFYLLEHLSSLFTLSQRFKRFSRLIIEGAGIIFWPWTPSFCSISN